MSDLRKTNHLINEKSPYLLEHAHNPVDWYPWGEEAFQKARAEDKPIFLSVGYSSCHWCHNFARESFEDEKIAAIMNEKFVSIKVDREERPDIDEVYMKAVIAMTGQGGWPLSVFLTPDLRPFYGGTYFPPTPRYGTPGFADVLMFVADLWKNKREEILTTSEELTKHVRELYALEGGGPLSREPIDGAYAELVTNFDEHHGGFSAAPKFPLPNCLDFLLRYYSRNKREPALRAARKTLDAMASGGIHDQLGGGFHRYSTDRFWLVPHFEKMLYDNALLAKVYMEAYQLTGEQSYLGTARDTLDWILSEMTGEAGGFYSAQDADTIDGEGYYYTWTPAEVERVLGKEEAALFNDLFGVTIDGNFEGGRSILHQDLPLQKVASRFGLEPLDAQKRIELAKKKLLEFRLKRNRPAVDDKVITSWNSLAISALAYSGGVLGDERFLQAAIRGAGFLLGNLRVEGRLLRRYRDGEVAIDGSLEDYAFLVAALLDLYEATFDAEWVREAIGLSKKMIELFWDETDGAFFMSSSEQVIARVKESYDGPMPSGNSVAIMSLLRVSEFTGRGEFREKAERAMSAFWASLESSPSAHTFMLSALDFSFGSKEIVVTGPTQDTDYATMLGEIRRRFLPNKVLAFADDKPPELASLTEGKSSIGGKPVVYVCENFTCRTPITSLQNLTSELNAGGARGH